MTAYLEKRKSTPVFAGIGDPAGQRARRDGRGRGQEHLRFLVAHAAGEITVRGADALHGCVHAAEGVHRAAQTCGATGVLGHLHSGVDEYLPHCLFAPQRGLQVVDDLRCRGHAKGVDRHPLALQHVGELQEVARLPARAGADVGAVQLHVHLLGLLALAGIGMARDGGFELAQIHHHLVHELLVLVALHGLVGRLGAVQLAAVIDECLGLLVELKDAVLSACLDRHVRDRHSVVHREALNARTIELHRPVRRAVKADLADAMQDDVLRHHAGLQFAFEAEVHRLRHLEQQLAGAHHEARVGVADAGRELIERAGHAGVRIGAEQDLTRTRMALLGQGGVADAGVVGTILLVEQTLRCVEHPMAIGVINDIVEVRQFLLADEVAEDVHVAVRLRIGGEDVVVRDNDDLGLVPHFGGLAELALEDADGAGAADIVGHQDIGRDPDVVTRLDLRLTRGARQ